MTIFLYPDTTFPLRNVVSRVLFAGTVTLGFLAPGLFSSGYVRAQPATSPASPAAPPRETSQPNPAKVMEGIAELLEKNANHVAVRLDDLPITQGEAAEYIRSMPVNMASLGYEGVFKEAMEALIRQKMMLLHARRDGLDKDPAVIRKDQIMAEKVLVDEWLSRKVKEAVTEQTLHARYDRTIAGKPGVTEVRARVILVPTETEANAIISKVQQGTDFAELAKQFSKDPSASAGGDLGYQPQDIYSPEVGAVAFSLSPGQLTAFPIRTSIGFYILRVDGRRQRAAMTFEEARPGLERLERADAVKAAVLNLTEEIRIVTSAKAGPAEVPKK